MKYHLCKCTVYFRSTRVRDVVERTKRDYIMAGHAFLRVLKSSGSKHELWTSECFIHRYGFAATGERFLMCSVKKKRMNERKKERKTSPHSKEKKGEGKRECMCVHIRACMREREGQSPYLYSTFVKVANKGVILSSCSILVQYSLAQSAAISTRKMRDRGQVMCNEREYVEYGNRSACIMMHSLSFRYLYFLAFSRAFHGISLCNSVCVCVDVYACRTAR